MSLPDFLSFIVGLCALVTAIYEMADFKRAPVYRKFIRGAKSFFLICFFLFYIYAIFGPDNYYIRIGLPSKFITILLFFIMGLDEWTLRQSQRYNLGEYFDARKPD